MSLLKEGHKYSFSQLESFASCPFGYYLQKIEHNPDLVSNAFASQGTLIHDLLDLWAKGMIPAEKLPEEYARRYPEEVKERWPRMLETKGYAEKAYQLGYDYFSNFDCFEGYDIVATEEKFEIDIAGRPFVGIVDMIMKDSKTGELIVLDHKSKSLDAFKKAEDEMYRQQLIYSKFVYEKYGKFPDLLMFNLFKENGLKKQRPFSKEQYEETLKWAEDIIVKIENSNVFDFLETKQVNPERPDFFCTELCSCRKVCPNGNKRNYKRK